MVLAVAETESGYVHDGCRIFQDRIEHYLPFEFQIIPEAKSWKKRSPAERKIEEGKAILGKLLPSDTAVLLDERGETFTSEAFSERIQRDMLSGTRRLVFIVGGAFGFSDEVYKAVPRRLALSKMTLSHQMVRVFLLEQIYRALTILRNEPYHNR